MKYSKFIIILGLLLFQLGAAQEKADVIVDKAMKEAQANKKNVLLIFHASWCQWCRLMEKNMERPEMRPVFEKRFVTAYVDVQEVGEKKRLENPGGQELMNRYKGEKAGLPFWLIISPKGEVMTDSFNAKGGNLGSPATQEEVSVFIAKLDQVSPLSAEEKKKIENVFVKK
ncbi:MULTISPECIES: thioredoxin family protein [Chryseobacterium]|uniref:Thiol-disulfide isomerase/thioredoxin n=1 Tax=Chryseobacterium camelliae TaxID=1265445 RepID=A0ABU0TEE7_9FLAO|nr:MULTISPECIES: thioredoxin family protein [Chryseobacterium]MDT3407002.1 thiol-disulfide isomerase/thioredoxin [Pseudacidovorax intermedius]MDQ1095206.1 thiol-disulfide isomerase/thioredoxin [Chryseobacterium camelliae]MDQ1099144.1 thiol-disulfide isomerase/thioredoxin [Chryseobacterium sp. SORGH_AS_1048]MDR6086493.1 thiol-disulfide isomerase/thioredoxin [Chryseobacterium sp. SORGH_AS_0909]MDR6130864.1 thiol-disulfide isomerase/thioredoxin [Chryseobacterium sp. SORGH_AS_1175]